MAAGRREEDVIDDDTVSRAVDRVLSRRLGDLQKSTGLPVVFGGTTRTTADGQQLTINHLKGTHGDSLRLLSVIEGRGLGGAAMARKGPCRVQNYASTAGITHDYDHVVVENEQLTAIMAFPILLHGSVRGLLYGAVREDHLIGDVALRNAKAIAASISRDVLSILDKPEPPKRKASAVALPDTHATALDELAALVRSTTDPDLRAALVRIHGGLSGEAPTPSSSCIVRPSLTPREVDALRLVAVGSTNAQVASELGLSVDTIKAYMHSAMRKLDAPNRMRAVLTAQQAGLL